MIENWVASPDFPDFYEVSNLGRVRRLGKELPLRPYKSALGYERVTLSINGSEHVRSVHRLICQAFHGAPPMDAPWVNHIDGDPSHNWPENLEWVSPSANAVHAFQTLRRPRCPAGEKHYCAKLTEADVREIRLLVQSGETYSSLGRLYGVNRNTIKQIFTGRSWSHVK
ncbi:HNH endonuclease [Cupriavidus gilardii]|uniref:HNH endonuclease n=1 Tax=Cupriavidus gilardii TaxID=82541 RepID=A0ABY4VR48_9BURK|nr:HNH endonuclease [Cupriavidus gilardii]USE79488.1 HNH endonuclease [Cupriavidus gilardii]